jgi:hypothetical protein
MKRAPFIDSIAARTGCLWTTVWRASRNIAIGLLDASTAAQPVLETAVVLGRRLRLPVVGFHLRQDDVEPERLLPARAAVELRLAVGVPAQAIVGALGGADVAMVVLGVRGHQAGPRPAGSTALAVADHAINRWWWHQNRAIHHRPACIGSWCRWTASRTRSGPWTRPCAGSPARASGL